MYERLIFSKVWTIVDDKSTSLSCLSDSSLMALKDLYVPLSVIFVL